MNKEPTKKTPIAIQILGWFLILGGVFVLAKIIFLGSDFSLQRGIWHGFGKFLGVITGLGFLKLQKWAVYLYFGLFVLATLVFYLYPPSEQIFIIYNSPKVIAIGLIVPSIVALIVWRHWKEFR